MRRPGWIAAAALLLPSVGSLPASPAELPSVIATFLADSGARTRGLPWSSGDQLPVHWATVRPAPNPDRFLQRQGLALVRRGSIPVLIGGKTADTMTLSLYGTAAGIQRVNLALAYNGDTSPVNPRVRVATALERAGFRLTPLKCSDKTEGATFGNLVFVMKAPGKTASALWESWNCAADGDCGLELTILYRKAELAQVECAGAG